MDLIGKTVRWDGTAHGHYRWRGQWFTARALRPNDLGGYVGVVIDPGNYRSLLGKPWQMGDEVSNLHPKICTVIDSEPDTQYPECE